MRLRYVTIALLAVLALAVPGNASAAFSARVSDLPLVQQIGAPYPFVVTVTNKGKWVKFFCLDFNDDDGSWLIRGPAGTIKYPKSDGFCVKTLRGGVRKFRFVLVPAEPGSHKLEVILGKGKLYEAIQKVLVDDDNALAWNEEFVLR